AILPCIDWRHGPAAQEDGTAWRACILGAARGRRVLPRRPDRRREAPSTRPGQRGPALRARARPPRVVARRQSERRRAGRRGRRARSLARHVPRPGPPCSPHRRALSMEARDVAWRIGFDYAWALSTRAGCLRHREAPAWLAEGVGRSVVL